MSQIGANMDETRLNTSGNSILDDFKLSARTHCPTRIYRQRVDKFNKRFWRAQGEFSAESNLIEDKFSETKTAAQKGGCKSTYSIVTE
jgi:hypothetical protein